MRSGFLMRVLRQWGCTTSESVLRERRSYGLYFQARHAGTGDGYRWNRDGGRGATCGDGPTREMRIRRQRGHAFRKSRITILAREKNRGSGFPWAAHEMPASRFCRPALVHTFHSTFPCPLALFLYTSSGLPPSIRRPRALIRPLACASLALNLPLRAASRKPDSSAISHVQCRMSSLYSTIGWDSSAFLVNFFFFSPDQIPGNIDGL